MHWRKHIFGVLTKQLLIELNFHLKFFILSSSLLIIQIKKTFPRAAFSLATNRDGRRSKWKWIEFRWRKGHNDISRNILLFLRRCQESPPPLRPHWSQNLQREHQQSEPASEQRCAAEFMSCISRWLRPFCGFFFFFVSRSPCFVARQKDCASLWSRRFKRLRRKHVYEHPRLINRSYLLTVVWRILMGFSSDHLSARVNNGLIHYVCSSRCRRRSLDLHLFLPSDSNFMKVCSIYFFPWQWHRLRL